MGQRLVLIGLVALMATWGSAAVVTAVPSGSHVALGAEPAAHPHPDLCDIPCGGTGDSETITVEVVGVPQFYTLAGGCEAYPANDANCQVFVPVNLAYTSTYSTQGDIQEVPVEPGNHAYTFTEPVGGTGFYASYNVDECNLPDPWNGCYNSAPPAASFYNHPGVDTSPYYYVGPAQAKFVPGCNGAPFGQIFGPNAAANGATTIVLTYDDCPGTPANDGGGGDDGGNSSWNDTNGSSDPCVNDTGDLNCLNATVGELNFTDVLPSATPACPACYTVASDSLPLRVSDRGVVSVFLWAGNYTWSEWATNRTLTKPGGSFGVVQKGRVETFGLQVKTHPLTFSEEGLPGGANWSLWVNGSTITTSNSSVTLREPNGSVPWFAVADEGSKTPKGGYAATLEGSTTTADYGDVVVAGDTSHTLAFESTKTATATLSATVAKTHRPGRPTYGDITFCGAVRPAALPFSATPYAADVPGVEECSVGGSHPVDLPFVVPMSSAKGGGAAVEVLGSPGSAPQSYAYSVYGSFASALLKHPSAWLKHPRALSSSPVGGALVAFSPPTGTFNVTDRPVTVKTPWTPVTNPLNLTVECDGVPNSGKTIACESSSDKGKSTACAVGDLNGDGIPDAVRSDDLNGDGIPDLTCAKLPSAGSTSGTVALALVNGTYNLTIQPIKGYWTNVGGVTDTHRAAAVVVDAPRPHPLGQRAYGLVVNFVPRTYNVTFSETGLPPGTNWSVSIPSDPNNNDPDHDWSSVTGTITVSLPNGTAKFSVVPVAGFTATAKSSVKVSGSSVEVPVVFQVAKGGGGTGLPSGLLGLVALLGIAPAVTSAGRRREASSPRRSPGATDPLPQPSCRSR